MALDSFYTFRALSCLGIFALWGVMMLNGSFVEMITTNLRGTFESGTILKKSWTGIVPLDFLVGVLVVFFTTVINTADLPDIGPYLMSLDLIGALAVVNMMTVVEDRRNRKTGPLRSASFWQTMWNLFGAASVFPTYCHVYLDKRGKHARPEHISQEQAQALPFTALWEIIISLPLLLPTLIWDDVDAAFRIQYGIVVWGLAPLTLSLFQDLVGTFMPAKTSSKLFSRPVVTTYWILGITSAIVHVGCIAVAPQLIPGLTWSRIYWPNHRITVAGPTLLIEGATMFCQYDYIIVSLSVLALGFYMFRAQSTTAVEAQAKGSDGKMLILSIVTVLLGPGAGLAWLMCDKEKVSEGHDFAGKVGKGI